MRIKLNRDSLYAVTRACSLINNQGCIAFQRANESCVWKTTLNGVITCLYYVYQSQNRLMSRYGIAMLMDHLLQCQFLWLKKSSMSAGTINLEAEEFRLIDADYKQRAIVENVICSLRRTWLR